MWDAIKKWFSGGSSKSEEQSSMGGGQQGACPECGMPMTEGHSHESESMDSSMGSEGEGSMPAEGGDPDQQM